MTEISDLMSEQLKTKVNEDLVRLAINDLRKNKLLEPSEQPIPPLTGPSRREIIKRVGFATMIALPVISSIVAPQAALTQSLIPGLAADCGSGNPPCNPGLTCGPCNGSGCPGSDRACCVGAGTHNGPGTPVTSCSASTDCSAAGPICCSGIAVFMATNCAMTPGNGFCFCQ